ncbi:MAG: autotransporter outer membrane beta-barrel domain-containing protein [Hellea sp.]|nr:autotransporter outer membrane beta-barrel domain-containing protein [Hellea sp.]
MSLKIRLMTASFPVLASVLSMAYAAPSMAQEACEVVDAEGNVTGGLDGTLTSGISTSNADDGAACNILINPTGTITITEGTGITVDSSNNVGHTGAINSLDVDNVTGIELQGGNAGELNLAGAINLTESTEPVDEDGDLTVDGPFATGSGRTGILISGSAPFEGTVNALAGSSIEIEGNDSYGFRLMETSSFTGDINLGGTIRVIGGIGYDVDGNPIGPASRAVMLEGSVTGDVNQNGSVVTQGEGTSAIYQSGDITGGMTNGGSISNTGYRFTSRGTVTAVPDAIDETDMLQAGAAIHIGGNLTQGLHLQREFVTTTDAEGVETTEQIGNSQINQFGSAAAILFDGDGTTINIGMIVPITNTESPELQFAFVNQGTISSDAIFDDLTATTMEVRDAILEGGISNSGAMTSQTYRGSENGTETTALSRVIVLGSGGMAEQIQNSGLIRAIVSENTNEIYADVNRPLSPQSLIAVAIDIEANASLTNIVNSGVIQASLVGREGTAIAIRDASGTLTTIDNTGTILAVGTTSDPLGNQGLNFTTIAIDLSANTSGVTINQTLGPDDDPEDDITPTEPQIVGNILLGDGNDVVNLESGGVTGDLDFAGGDDVLALSGGASYEGTLTNTGGLIITAVDGSSLTQTTATPIDATSASFDATSAFNPTIDGQTGDVSTLNTTGDIFFGNGATIVPILTNVIDPTNNSFTLLYAGGALTLEGTVNSLVSFESPFMYETNFALDPNNANALLITLDLRSAEAMGLDGAQSAAFGTTFDALIANPTLAQAFVNITDGDEFRGSLNQLLPEFAAAARHFVVANVDGAVGAVGSHLDNARQSQDQGGGAWVQEFTYFADRDLAGLSEQYRGFGFGFTGGLDTSFGPFHTAGVNFGFASTEIEDVLGIDEPLDVMTFQGGLYGGFEAGDFSLDIYGGGGFNEFDQNRLVEIGNFSDSAQGSWSGTHVNASLRGGYDLALSKKLWARPSFSIDYLRMSENAYTETGTAGTSAIALDVDGRTSELAGATAMLNIGANFEGKRTWIRPSIRAGYRSEFINDGVVTSYGFAGLPSRSTIISEAFPEQGFLLGFSVAAGSGYSSFGFDFDSDIRDGFVRHTGRFVLRMIF